MSYALALIALLFMGLALTLNAFSMPGNWVLLAIVLIWKLSIPASMDWTFIGMLAGVAVTGEVLEFVSQMIGGRKYGSSGRGSLGGIIGTFAGAILGAPFFFGLGALVGALAGAYLGCLALELGQGRSMDVARRSAWGQLWGRFFGMVIKFGLGVTMLVLSIPRIWPG